jgi:hypothetical protein
MALAGRIMTDCEWYTVQVEFIHNHQYFTSAARALFDAQKQINEAEMAALLAECTERALT